MHTNNLYKTFSTLNVYSLIKTQSIEHSSLIFQVQVTQNCSLIFILTMLFAWFLVPLVVNFNVVIGLCSKCTTHNQFLEVLCSHHWNLCLTCGVACGVVCCSSLLDPPFQFLHIFYWQAWFFFIICFSHSFFRVN